MSFASFGVSISRRRPGMALAVVLLLASGCGEPKSSNETAKTGSSTDQVVTLDDADQKVASIKTFCGNCHAMPMPESFPKAMWYEEVRRGFNFYYESGRTDLKPPAQTDVVDYFRSRAPETLTLKEHQDASPSPVQFVRTELMLKTPEPVAVSFIDWRADSNGSGDFWLSDMKSGSILHVANVGQFFSTEEGSTSAGAIHLDATVSAHPAAVRHIDLDANGEMDLLVTDLGSFLPEDHRRGQLVWVSDGAGSSAKPPVVLWKGIGRIADVQPIDVDGDGGIDLAVAEFGWHKTGSVTLLKNVSSAGEPPRFDVMPLDNRPGAIHVIPFDLDNDNRLDIISIISQEHEQVVAYLNKPTGFEKQVLYAAPDPSWGSSGIQLVDLDKDGDSDIIYTNGDSFDSKLAKPYHGVSWLENTGELKFTPHHIASLPGIHRALAADFDGDGDLDIAAAAMLPTTTIEGLSENQWDAVVWLEQTTDRQFVRHVLERGAPNYAAMTVGDFNNDGRPDLAVGMFEATLKDVSTIAKIYWNVPK